MCDKRTLFVGSGQFSIMLIETTAASCKERSSRARSRAFSDDEGGRSGMGTTTATATPPQTSGPAATVQPIPPSFTDPDILAAETIERFGEDPDFVTALARGLAVLLALSDKRRRMSIAQV